MKTVIAFMEKSSYLNLFYSDRYLLCFPVHWCDISVLLPVFSLTTDDIDCIRGALWVHGFEVFNFWLLWRPCGEFALHITMFTSLGAEHFVYVNSAGGELFFPLLVHLISGTPL